MSLAELLIIAVGLSMDAFAVAVGKGLSMRQVNAKHALAVGLWFGISQAIMPFAGYRLGALFADNITPVDHWIAFVLLGLIGGKMIKESFIPHGEEDGESDSLHWRDMLPLALATSIDALAVGVSFSFLQVRIVPAVVFIGIITLLLSMIGVRLGHLAGLQYRAKAELFGGVILVLMGVKILLEHQGIL